MDENALRAVAALLEERNAIDAEIARHIGRPMTAGHLGEWIAAQVFDIDLAAAANVRAIDGRFASGPLAGRTVNVKWYPRREGILDLTGAVHPDYYLVLAGPAAPAVTSRGGVRPWCVESVHLFDAPRLLADQRSRGVGTGTASSVPADRWAAAETYPRPADPVLAVHPGQAAVLRRFAPPQDASGIPTQRLP
ncbi:hypothetical protein [Polymorphospora sp. NPDC050346]|uniref:hypothetical protein n=1 Tax=Polymorphospora sp. NPDC050346 TaxID=3155780 RepID=UPI0033F0D138